jgi:methylaspartate mutase epsilon subunit
MGVYPRTPEGASRLLSAAARLAVRTGAERLIVKTSAEAYWIPSIADNVEALELAAAVADAAATDAATTSAATTDGATTSAVAADTGIYAEAKTLIQEIVDLNPDLGRALTDGFRLGYLDIPYCLHPDNAGQTRSYIDGTGRLQWSRIGSMPLQGVVRPAGSAELTAAGLLASLSFVERRFDHASLEADPDPEIQAAKTAVTRRDRPREIST